MRPPGMNPAIEQRKAAIVTTTCVAELEIRGPFVNECGCGRGRGRGLGRYNESIDTK